jgi:hypothetical protein
VIRVCDEAGNVIETHEHTGDFKGGDALASDSSRTKSRYDAADDEPILTGGGNRFPN